MESSVGPYFSRLPVPIHLHVIYFLEIRDISSIARLNSVFYELLKEESLVRFFSFKKTSIP
jgi:hypothetical protein